MLSVLRGLVTVVGFGLSQRTAAEFQATSVVHDPIKGGVSKSRFADHVVPNVKRRLACDEGRNCNVAVFDDFHEVTALASGAVQRRCSSNPVVHSSHEHSLPRDGTPSNAGTKHLDAISRMDMRATSRNASRIFRIGNLSVWLLLAH